MQVDVLVDRSVSVLATLSELTSTTMEVVVVEPAPDALVDRVADKLHLFTMLDVRFVDQAVDPSELTSTTQEDVLVETAVVVETATEEFVLVLLSTMEGMEETSMFAPLFLLPSPNLK